MIQRFQTCLPEDVINFQLFISGNEKGFAYFYKLLYKPFHYFTSQLLKDNLEIDCIIQDAFLYAWQRHDSFENLKHLYLSIKLYIKWGCARYRKNKRRRDLTLIEFYKIEINVTYNPDLAGSDTEELLTLLENSMPYLPATRKNILELYKRGFSPKTISKQLGVSRQKVTSEMAKGIRSLKLILPTLQKAYQASQRKRVMPVVDYEVYLTKQQAKIFTLYYKNKLPFSFISRKLGLDQFELLKEHYAAMNILNRVKMN